MFMYSDTVRKDPVLLATAQAFENAIRKSPEVMRGVVLEAKSRNVYGDKVLAERAEAILYKCCPLTQQGTEHDNTQPRADT